MLIIFIRQYLAAIYTINNLFPVSTSVRKGVVLSTILCIMCTKMTMDWLNQPILFSGNILIQ